MQETTRKTRRGHRFGGCGLDSSGSEQEAVSASCKQDNEPSGSIKGGGISWLAERAV
jgi:hypothetical protein